MSATFSGFCSPLSANLPKSDSSKNPSFWGYPSAQRLGSGVPQKMGDFWRIRLQPLHYHFWAYPFPPQCGRTKWKHPYIVPLWLMLLCAAPSVAAVLFIFHFRRCRLKLIYQQVVSGSDISTFPLFLLCMNMKSLGTLKMIAINFVILMRAARGCNDTHNLTI